jgi:hypothetical protein
MTTSRGEKESPSAQADAMTLERSKGAPELITSASLARTVAKRWRRQYPNADWGMDKLDIGRKLAALKSPTPKAITALVGNSSWTQVPRCDGCNKRPRAVVRFGDDQDCDSTVVTLCKKCVALAAAAFGEKP